MPPRTHRTAPCIRLELTNAWACAGIWNASRRHLIAPLPSMKVAVIWQGPTGCRTCRLACEKMEQAKAADWLAAHEVYQRPRETEGRHGGKVWEMT